LLRSEQTHWELPVLPCSIQAATLNGKAISYSQKDGTLSLDLDKADLDPIDTLIQLKLNGSAMDLEAINPQASAKATASNVFQKQESDYGPQNAFDHDSQTRWATDGGTKQAWITSDFGKPRSVSRLHVEEAIEERVRQFELQYRSGNEWKTIFAGTRLGLSFDKTFPTVVAQEFRLNITDATEGPTLSEIELLP
jgi:alpha-L-fucosidase